MRVLRIPVGAILVNAGAGLIANIASAADVPIVTKAPSAAVQSWTGCYAGLQAGGAQSDARWRYDGANPYNSADPAGPVLISEQAFDEFKAAAGAQLGCNYNFAGPWVVGLEAGIIATPMDTTVNSGIDITAGFGFTGNVRTEISGIASLAARLGYSLTPDWLVYAKGGYAAAYLKLRGNITPSSFEQFTWSDSSWHHGWTVGAGAEYRLFRNVTVGAEYGYYRFASESYFGAQGGLGPANQVRVDADAEVHAVMARINFYDPTSPAARIATAHGAAGPRGEFSSFVDTSVKYSSWSGDRGPNVFQPERGKGHQVFSPFQVGLDYVEPNTVKVEARAKGGYVYTAQQTPGQRATYAGPVDTQTSLNVVLLGFESIRPQFGVAFNVPTGTSYLPNNQRFTRIDPDLVEVGSYGAGFNINPTAGFVVGIDENTAVSLSAGYAWQGTFMREAVSLEGAFGSGAFDLKRYINPGDVFTANANITTQIGDVVVLGTFAFMSETRVVVDGVDSGRAGGRYNSNLTLTKQIDERWAVTANGSWSFQEKNEINLGGGLTQEPKNSNSHVLIGSVEPSYMVTERLRLAASYGFLWRDENFYDQLENQYIPAKTKHTAGASARYAVTPSASIEVRGSHSWIKQEDSAILPVTLAPLVVAAIPPELHYRSWTLSMSANFRF